MTQTSLGDQGKRTVFIKGKTVCKSLVYNYKQNINNSSL